MLYSPGATLAAGVDPVLRNVVERTSVLPSGLLVHRLHHERRIEYLPEPNFKDRSLCTTNFSQGFVFSVDAF